MLTLHKASLAQILSSAKPTYSAEFVTRNEKFLGLLPPVAPFPA